MTQERISNAQARQIFMHRHLLSGVEKDAAIEEIITALGFVQLDSIATVERAHHMILHARMPHYRPAMLDMALGRDRSIFEHWTHDASVIPTEFYPYWHMRFDRDKERLAAQWKRWQRHGVSERADDVLAHIRANGPCCSADFSADRPKKSTGWWDWHPSKTALEFLWRTGELAVTHRAGFQKHYDLAENVIPQSARNDRPGDTTTIEWCCDAALARLGFATANEIAAFWATVTLPEAKLWCASELAAGRIIEADIMGADGRTKRVYARPELTDRLADLPNPSGAIRVLSPFDPALRDRKRALFLFGFDYKIEVFTPEAQRKYGYYVFPLLEGSQIIGRIDMKAHRADETLRVAAFWPERGVSFGKGRFARLEAALARTARFAGCSRVDYAPGWERSSL